MNASLRLHVRAIGWAQTHPEPVGHQQHDPQQENIAAGYGDCQVAIRDHADEIFRLSDAHPTGQRDIRHLCHDRYDTREAAKQAS